MPGHSKEIILANLIKERKQTEQKMYLLFLAKLINFLNLELINKLVECI